MSRARFAVILNIQTPLDRSPNARFSESIDSAPPYFGEFRSALFGAADKDSADPIDNPVTPEDLAATIYHAMGIDPETQVLDAQGRPNSLIENATVVERIFG